MRRAIASSLVAMVCFFTTEASAQQANPPAADTTEQLAPPGTILAPSNALELQFEAGYTQPFGEIADGADIHDVAVAGFVGGGALAYRINPIFAIAGYGGFHHSASGDEHDGQVFGGAAGLAANIHFLPYGLVDPYITVGAGYRLFFVSPDGTADNHMYHGFQVMKTNFGVDFRTSDSFAIGPMIGADLNMLLWDQNLSTGEGRDITNQSLSTFVFAGVSTKFDVLGDRVPEYAYDIDEEPQPAAGPPQKVDPEVDADPE